MSKTRMIKPYADAMSMMMQREQMPATGEYETMKSNTSIMDDPSAHVMEYIFYCL